MNTTKTPTENQTPITNTRISVSKDMILIAGGGTGGHIYPAVAIAQALKNQGIYAEFVGTLLGLEKKIIPREGFRLHTIPAGPLNGVTLKTKIFSLLMLPWGIYKAIRLILKLKPIVVLGVGGYASGPIMLAAILTGQRTAVFEPNAYPGLTNRWLARFVDVAFINFEVSRKFFKNAFVFGIPVRSGLEHSSSIAESSSEKLKVLIFGGSQGARGINTVVVKAFKEALVNNQHWLDEFEFVHQIGATDWHYFDKEYKNLGLKNVKWFEFLYDMPERYKWAELIICRAGAATISELANCGKAAVLVPFPQAADNHQQKNADALGRQKAALVITQKDFTPAKFIETLRYFNANRSEIKKFEENVRKFHIEGTADKIVAELLKLKQKA